MSEALQQGCAVSRAAAFNYRRTQDHGKVSGATHNLVLCHFLVLKYLLYLHRITTFTLSGSVVWGRPQARGPLRPPSFRLIRRIPTLLLNPLTPFPFHKRHQRSFGVCIYRTMRVERLKLANSGSNIQIKSEIREVRHRLPDP